MRSGQIGLTPDWHLARCSQIWCGFRPSRGWQPSRMRSFSLGQDGTQIFPPRDIINDRDVHLIDRVWRIPERKPQENPCIAELLRGPRVLLRAIPPVNARIRIQDLRRIAREEIRLAAAAQ